MRQQLQLIRYNLQSMVDQSKGFLWKVLELIVFSVFLLNWTELKIELFELLKFSFSVAYWVLASKEMEHWRKIGEN